jgi:O-succinylbenzoic acid--CoA ligase
MHTYTINGRSYSDHELQVEAEACIQGAPNWEKSHWQVILDWLSNPEYIEAKTSGSTGSPKIIRHSARAVRASAKITAEYFDLKEGSAVFLCLPSQFIGGKMMILRSLIHGWHLDWCEPSAFPFEAVHKHYDLVAITPHQCGIALERNYSFSSFTHILLGGAALSAPMHKVLCGLPNTFYLGYAMTESLTHIAMQKIDALTEPGVFSCLGQTTVHTDSRGCLVIHAPHLDTPEIITNDLGECISPASFRLFGRIDHVINSGGVKVIPEEIEAALASEIQTPFYITKKDDSILGEIVVLKVEDKPWNPERLHRFHEWMDQVLSKFQRPKEIIFVDAFKYTENQKIIKR